MNEIFKRIGVMLIVGMLFTGCGGGDSSSKFSTEPHKVIVTMESGDTFTIETAPEFAPETCANFLGLVKEGF